EGQVRDEVVVHHVDVDPVGARDASDLLSEAREVSVQDGRRDLDTHAGSLGAQPASSSFASPWSAPSASSRSAHSSSGARSNGWSSISAWRSPSSTKRWGTVRMEKSAGSQSPTSSHLTGVLTKAFGTPRTE